MPADIFAVGGGLSPRYRALRAKDPDLEMLFGVARFDGRKFAAPVVAAAESQLQAGAVSRKVSATAHVDFRIVIPKYCPWASRAGKPRVSERKRSRFSAIAALRP